MQRELICQAYDSLKKSAKLLEYSINNYKPFDPTIPYTYEDLEDYDALSFRFEKYTEVLIYFFKTLEIYLFAEASETLRKRFEKMAKLGLVSDVEQYMQARTLRNKVAHSYAPEKLEYIYSSILKFGKMFLEDFDKIKKFIKEEIKC